jgi:hypothetical protein
MAPTLVILAAGMGSRYGGLKQLDPVGPDGEIMMEYSIFDAVRAGFEEVIFVIRKDFEREFDDLIGKKLKVHVRYRYAFQELDDLPLGYEVPEGRVKPWGTGHALLVAAPLISGPFAVIFATSSASGREGKGFSRTPFGTLSSIPHLSTSSPPVLFRQCASLLRSSAQLRATIRVWPRQAPRSRHAEFARCGKKH